MSIILYPWSHRTSMSCWINKINWKELLTLLGISLKIKGYRSLCCGCRQKLYGNRYGDEDYQGALR